MENPLKTSSRCSFVIDVNDIYERLCRNKRINPKHIYPVQVDKFVRFQLFNLGVECQHLCNSFYKVTVFSSSLLPVCVDKIILTDILYNHYINKLLYYGYSY